MSDYELAYLFTMTTDRGSTVFMDYITILFAFLVASFFVAGQLSRKMTWVVISSYIFAQMTVLTVLNAISGGLTGMIFEMNSRRQQGSETFAMYGNLTDRTDLASWMAALSTLLMSLIVLASIWFFFERRRIETQKKNA